VVICSKSDRLWLPVVSHCSEPVPEALVLRIEADSLVRSKLRPQHSVVHLSAAGLRVPCMVPPPSLKSFRELDRWPWWSKDWQARAWQLPRTHGAPLQGDRLSL
jgi:hypothetical protein